MTLLTARRLLGSWNQESKEAEKQIWCDCLQRAALRRNDVHGGCQLQRVWFDGSRDCVGFEAFRLQTKPHFVCLLNQQSWKLAFWSLFRLHQKLWHFGRAIYCKVHRYVAVVSSKSQVMWSILRANTHPYKPLKPVSWADRVALRNPCVSSSAFPPS